MKKGIDRSLCKALLVLSSSLVFCSFPKDFDVRNRLTKDNSCAMEYCGENECISLGKQGVGTFLLHHQQLSLCCLGLCHAAGLNTISWRGAVESECFAFQVGTVPAVSLAIVTVQKAEFLN